MYIFFKKSERCEHRSFCGGIVLTQKLSEKEKKKMKKILKKVQKKSTVKQVRVSKFC